ncbi:MAG: proprotein convertase P-domain-containing protein [Myxococcota bacterium]|nr:proprotein convertase P-domain-containing protein [Myxococcota bacterium]
MAASLTLALIALVGSGEPAFAQPQSIHPAPVVRGAEAMPPVPARFSDIDLRSIPLRQSWRAGEGIRFVPRRFHLSAKLVDAQSKAKKPVGKNADPLLEIQAQAAANKAFSMLELNIGGGGFTGVSPPDTVGDIGTNYYIQSTNASAGSTFRVYNKETGALVAGPLSMDSLSTGLADCSNGAGDPIVLYDSFAGRWLLSEFSDTGNKLCVYISATGDPLAGGWYGYEFSAPQFPDYPKYGIWHDAYYVGTNESAGPGVYALDRTSMLAGQPAGMQRFTAPSLAGFGFQIINPADADGSILPPPGTPNFFVRHNDDESHNPSSNDPSSDFLEIFEFQVDFVNAANSTFTGPLQIPIAEFDSNLCGLSSFVCIPQPNGGIGLDPLREVSMFRVQYRNKGATETLVGSHATDVDNTDHSGIRWWELSRSGGGAWSLVQEGTYAPDGHSRWMSSVATDGDGNLAIGYSIGSASLAAGLSYNGRLQADPLGTLTQGETTIIAGAGTHSNERWGDYSAINVDPVDDCTFWYTSEYARSNGTWGTQIGKFKFDSCGTPGIVLSASNLSQAICAPGSATPIALEVISSGGFTGSTELSFPYLPPDITGTFSATPVIPSAQSTINFTLQPTTIFKNHPIEILATPTGADPQSLQADIQVFTQVPDVPNAQIPVDGAVNIPRKAPFNWPPSYQAENYTVEVDDDPSFSSIDFTATGAGSQVIAETALLADTTYYWRIRTSNPCGESTTPVRSFTTSSADLFCNNPALAIPDNGSVSDSMTLTQGGALTGLDMTLNVSHTYIGDLKFTLTHQETGTSALLVDRPGVPASTYGCSRNNISATLSDSASLPIENECRTTTPSIIGTLSPNNPLSVFAGEDLAGTWILLAEDAVAADVGAIDQWCLAPTQVPEPSSSLLMVSGILFLLGTQVLRGREPARKSMRESANLVG